MVNSSGAASLPVGSLAIQFLVPLASIQAAVIEEVTGLITLGWPTRSVSRLSRITGLWRNYAGESLWSCGYRESGRILVMLASLIVASIRPAPIRWMHRAIPMSYF